MAENERLGNPAMLRDLPRRGALKSLIGKEPGSNFQDLLSSIRGRKPYLSSRHVSICQVSEYLLINEGSKPRQ